MQYRTTKLAASVLLSLTALNAHATLKVTDNGLGVYDSGLNATWTQDANLLGTWEGAYQSTSYYNIVNAIIANDPVIHDTPNEYDGSYRNYEGGRYLKYSGTYTLSANDFGSGGTVDWWAAQAYVSYLNSLNNGVGYSGSNNWTLPTTVDNLSSQNFIPSPSSSQLAELFYSELHGTGSLPIPSGPFSNLDSYAYWSGTEHGSFDPISAWIFNHSADYQTSIDKVNLFSAWVVSSGQVSAIPVPGAVWLFGTGILGLLGLKRRGHAG